RGPARVFRFHRTAARGRHGARAAAIGLRWRTRYVGNGGGTAGARKARPGARTTGTSGGRTAGAAIGGATGTAIRRRTAGPAGLVAAGTGRGGGTLLG